ncbi:MAG: Lrp/AsnC family transcriptional regulator [Fusobacteriaceae bacterium]|jgi:Lrp/AsnC family leucine-responsive transcriptional regulator|nr:Lrp/AsnC family transcriptional regulator [Fusobacteriaceae bacterium]MBP9510709.1 Lrp/AsnC family transcriptional regulator [Fusobacteriaceae bacterium]
MIDEIDKKIIEELSKNSRISMRELGEKIFLTGQATSTRVAKLEDMKIIKGYTLEVDYSLIGKAIHVILNIYTNSPQHYYYLKFIDSQKDNLLHNYKISGDGCYLIEARFSTTEELDEFLLKLNKYANYKLTIILKDII